MTSQFGRPFMDKNTKETALRNLLSRIIRQCPKNRTQIAEELTALTGRRVTVHMLNDFTAESKKGSRFPASLVTPFCEVVGSDELQRHILSPRLRNFLTLGEFFHIMMIPKFQKQMRVGKRHLSVKRK